MENIKQKFSIIEDERHQSYVEHKLCDILIIIMCAVLCGLDELAGISEYANNKSDFLREAFGIDKTPSKPTFCRILNMIDGDKAASVIIEIMKENVCELGEIIAVDGKAIRSTSKKGKPHSALQILSAYLTESGITIAQQAIHKKTNEIPVFQEMLDSLDVKDKIITADAMHCQKKTCKKIVNQGGNYVFGLKENQKNLYEEVDLYFADYCHKFETFSTTEKGHGRIETRICYKLDDITWLSVLKDWAGLKSVIAIKRITEHKNGKSQELSYFITDYEGKEIEVIVSVEIFEIFEDGRKQDLREQNELRRHRDYRGLQNYYVLQELASPENDLEIRVFNKLLLHQIFEVVKTCSPLQQKRFHLYFVEGYTMREIARTQKCNHSTVSRSVETVVRKIKRICKTGHQNVEL